MIAQASIGAGDDTCFSGEGDLRRGDEGWGNEELAVEEAAVSVLEDHCGVEGDLKLWKVVVIGVSEAKCQED